MVILEYYCAQHYRNDFDYKVYKNKLNGLVNFPLSIYGYDALVLKLWYF